MQVHFGAELLRAEWQSSVACIGTFDGVHLGHQAVIAEAVRRARERELPPVLLTFDRHPAAILAPEKCPPAIASVAANLKQFERLGVAVSVVLPFDRTLSETSAEVFFRQIVQQAVRCRHLVIGHDFAFGRDRQGTPAWLSGHIETHVVEPFKMDGQRVSSSAVRAAVADGRMRDAERWLGRPFAVEGVVVGGQKLGRSLGFPTINLARSFSQAMPRDGVYAGVAHIDAASYGAAIGVGVRPAVGGGPRTIEAYLINYCGDPLYGRHVILELHEKLRDEQDFASLDDLKNQMAADVREAGRVLQI